MLPEIEIAGRKIGPAHAPLVVAEIGINHEGSLAVAMEMVEAAARAGVEVVKHQTHIVEDAGAKAITIHGRTAKQSYSGLADWDFVTAVARTVSIPVFGSGDCIEPEDIIIRMKSGVSGVYVGRGVLRNPWILAQARDLMAGKLARTIAPEERGQFLLDYMHLLLTENVPESGKALSRERWVINKIRALCSWYTKGFEGGAQFRIGVNTAKSIAELQDLIEGFFFAPVVANFRSAGAQ